MVLDVILPTFNREALLARTLESLARRRGAGGLDVRILVVDNASTDGTRALVRRQAHASTDACTTCMIATPGKPYALNAGIAATRATSSAS